jgi:hypothetical protein
MPTLRTLSFGAALRLLVAGNLAGSALLVPDASANAQDMFTPKFVAAYRASEAARAAAAELESMGYAPGALRAATLATFCDAVGCNSRGVVAHTFRTAGARSQTTAVLAEVTDDGSTDAPPTYGVRARLARVERVSDDDVAFDADSASIRAAFESNQEIAAQIARLSPLDSTSYRELPIAGDCHSAGCSSTTLAVLHVFPAVDSVDAAATFTQSYSIIGQVAVDAFGTVTDVDRVEIVADAEDAVR